MLSDGTGVLHVGLCPLLPFPSGPLGQLRNDSLGSRPPGGSSRRPGWSRRSRRPRACRAAGWVSENREAFQFLETGRWMDLLTTALCGLEGSGLDGGRAALQVRAVGER